MTTSEQIKVLQDWIRNLEGLLESARAALEGAKRAEHANQLGDRKVCGNPRCFTCYGPKEKK